MTYQFTAECPRCGGEMIVETRDVSYRDEQCMCCGRRQLGYYDMKSMSPKLRTSHPSVFMCKATKHNNLISTKSIYGAPNHRMLKDWVRNIQKDTDVDHECTYCTIWDKKHQKLRVVYGNPPMYDASGDEFDYDDINEYSILVSEDYGIDSPTETSAYPF